MTEPTFATRAAALRQRNDELAASQPGQRARNLAQALGVSEAEWIAAGCNGARVTALRGKPPRAARKAASHLPRPGRAGRSHGPHPQRLVRA
ncbi:hypothetical protein L564_3544 [Bordetella pertussis CHLA-15]|nr:hypothetical protein L564_3544 [Bordetella pertussis CHLA-15]